MGASPDQFTAYAAPTQHRMTKQLCRWSRTSAWLFFVLRVKYQYLAGRHILHRYSVLWPFPHDHRSTRIQFTWTKYKSRGKFNPSGGTTQNNKSGNLTSNNLIHVQSLTRCTRLSALKKLCPSCLHSIYLISYPTDWHYRTNFSNVTSWKKFV